jgi:hypothetical protein
VGEEASAALRAIWHCAGVQSAVDDLDVAGIYDPPKCGQSAMLFD